MRTSRSGISSHWPALLLVALWLEERHGWQLGVATLLLAAAMSTKREGMLFAVCRARRGARRVWRGASPGWTPLLVTGLVAFALTLPWRIWFTAEGIPSDRPETGYLGSFRHVDRVWPSLRLVLRTLFDHDLWPFVAALGVAAVVLAALAGAWRLAAYSAVFLGASLAMCTWAIWSNIDLPFSQEDEANPIVRLTGTPILVLAVLTPLLLERTWSARTTPASAEPAGTVLRDALVFRSRWAWVCGRGLGLLSHPGAMLVGYSRSGLPGTLPHFPSAIRLRLGSRRGRARARDRRLRGYVSGGKRARGSCPSRRARRDQNRPGRLWSPAGVRRGHGVGGRLAAHAGRRSGGGSSSCARERRGPAMKTAIRVGIVACVMGACLDGCGKA